jgi:hypothetical protein
MTRNFVISALHLMLLGDYIEKDQFGTTCSTHRTSNTPVAVRLLREDRNVVHGPRSPEQLLFRNSAPISALLPERNKKMRDRQKETKQDGENYTMMSFITRTPPKADNKHVAVLTRLMRHNT